MKKIVSVLLSLISVVCLTFAFSGCGDNNDREVTEEKWYSSILSSAYEQSRIDCYALESIACSYYEWRGFENNPYKDKYISTEELSTETENKIKKAYCESFSQPVDINEVKILNYYGKYDNNFVVTLGFNDVDFQKMEGADVTVGNVVLPDFNLYEIQIRVFFCHDKAPDEKVKGTLFDLEKAYKNGLIDEEDLKSIACGRYENFQDLENPYSGLYQKPQKGLSYETKLDLRKAYSEQIDRLSSAFEEIKLYNYYGTYNGNIVVSVSGEGCYFPDNTDKNIGGVNFINNSSDWIFVYKPN